MYKFIDGNQSQAADKKKQKMGLTEQVIKKNTLDKTDYDKLVRQNISATGGGMNDDNES